MPSPPIYPLPSVPNFRDPPYSNRPPTSPETLRKIIATNDSNLNEERYFSTKSPYYKGLTDFSLVINRKRLLVASSPVRESDPPIPHSLSDPDVAEIHQSLPQSHDEITDSSKSSTSPLISWHKKIGNIIRRRNSLDLTHDEHFEDIEKKSPINPIAEDKRYSTSSPYYKGLTDFTLVLNRERLLVEPIHGREPNQRSISDPKISKTHDSHPESTTPPFDPPPQTTKVVTNSTKKMNSELTQENLEELDKKNEILEDKRYSTQSPYYNGLTDFSLVINREKIPLPPSPDRESQAGSSTTSSSSRSSFVVKVQEWSASCFNPKKSHNKNAFPSYSLSTKTRTATRENTNKESINVGRKDVTKVYMDSGSSEILNHGKPLRERVSEPAKRPPLSPPQTLPAKDVVLVNAKETNETENERKFFWADKYRPDALDDFICNRNKAIELQNLAKAEACCHYIFEGLPGVGKRTMISALLRETFGPEKVEAREKCIQFDLKGEAVSSIQVNVKESSQHIEVNLSELKGYEKHVIVELIKETNKSLIDKASQCNSYCCRAIVLYEADKLSTDSLLYIRWLLEKYKGFNKAFFFCCNDVSKLQPIRSLCTLVQLLPPSNEKIVEVLKFIAKQEGIDLPHQLAEKIANNSKNNLRQSIRSFEASWQSNPSLKEDQEILTGWEDDIAKIAKNIVEEQSPKQLYNIRGKLQKLIEHNVSPEFIFQTLRDELKKHLDEKLHMQLKNIFEEYNRDGDSEKPPFPYGRNRTEDMSKREHDPVKKNIKHFMRIEEFIAKFMSLYKSCDKSKNVT